MLAKLKKIENFTRKPLVFVIMDGVGISKYDNGDAIKSANTPALDWLYSHCMHRTLKAHGTAVGLPSDADMGNSEVGHNAMGAGRVFDQGAKLVANALETGAMFAGETWKKLINNCLKNNSTLHFIGLFSDGNVHSHIEHLKEMILQAKKDGIKTLRIHILLDGRDVPKTSALDYLLPFEEFLNEINKEGLDFRIASGGGRMSITMDRYDADWSMVQRAWDTHVLGKGTMFNSAEEAIRTLREKTNAIDQDLPPFVIAENNIAIGKIKENDSVINFNFRGDRAIEISKAFDYDELTQFNRGVKLNVEYAGMMEYDGDLKIPKNFLVTPPAIDKTVGEYLCAASCKTLAISETQKFGHVTYFYNGNKSGKIDDSLEDYIEITSDIIPFEQRPWMKSAEITDKVIEALKSGKYDFIRLNFPNGDMVGHTGVFQATQIAVETVDLAISRIMNVVKEVAGILLISADHGNADDMYERDKKTKEAIVDSDGFKSKTSHSLNPVPCLIYDPKYNNEYTLNNFEELGISSLAATCINLLGYEAPENYDQSVINLK